MSGNTNITYVKDCAFFRPKIDSEEVRKEILAKGYDYLCEIEKVIVFKKREMTE